jgi:hypothetical protein
MPADKDIKSMLCRGWETDYALMGSTRVDRVQAIGNFVYQFKNNNTYLLYDSAHRSKYDGAWVYNSDKKEVDLYLKGRIRGRIISLHENKLIMIVGQARNTGEGESEIRVVYKTKNS